MNQPERYLIARVQDCLHEMMAMTPKNPCNTEFKFDAHNRFVRLSGILYAVIGDIWFREYINAGGKLYEAETMIREWKEKWDNRSEWQRGDS